MLVCVNADCAVILLSRNLLLSVLVETLDVIALLTSLNLSSSANTSAVDTTALLLFLILSAVVVSAASLNATKLAPTTPLGIAVSVAVD